MPIHLQATTCSLDGTVRQWDIIDGALLTVSDEQM